MVTYDEAKRIANLVKHAIDLEACASVFDAPMLTVEDARESYGEQRLILIRVQKYKFSWSSAPLAPCGRGVGGEGERFCIFECTTV